MSDLHGRYDLYRMMLEKINLSDSDTLYILGDYVDRAPDGFKIIFDMAERRNVIPLMGNHDRTAEFFLSRLNRGIPAEEMASLEAGLDNWLYYNGGDVTLEDFRALSADRRLLALRLINSYPAYKDLTVGANRFLLCHAGVRNYTPRRELSDYSEGDFIYKRPNFYNDVFSDRYLVVGHTPTALINSESIGAIFKNGHYIAIDCGAVFGMKLGCISLDTFEEFYVE